MSSQEPRRGKAGLASRLLEGVEARLALLGFELGEERDRFLASIVGAIVAAILVFVGLLTANFLLVLMFWDQRILVAGCLVAGYLLGGLALAATIRARLRDAPQPFAATLDELRKDADACRDLGGSS